MNSNRRYIEKHNGYLYRKDHEHPNTSKQGYVAIHRLIYEHYLKILFDEDIYIPKGVDIHHIDGNRQNNSLINLTPLTKMDHARHTHTGNNYVYGRHKDTSNRICYNCRSDKTRTQIPSNKDRTPYLEWHHLPYDKVNWYCYNCYMRIRRNLK
jgi:hypothetical protein